MKLLCGSLGVEWEEVSVETTRKLFAQELVAYFERRGWLSELTNQVWNDRPTMIQNSGLVEPINHYDLQEEYIGKPTSSSSINWWIGVFVVAVLIVIAVWYSDSNAQKRKELRDSEGFVTGYFSLLDSGCTQDAWERLSGDYRVNKYSTGYAPYAQYWVSFRKIEILKLAVLDETDRTASVEVVLALLIGNNYLCEVMYDTL